MSEKQILEMAKLIYFNLDGGAAGEWEKLGPEKQDEYLKQVQAIVDNFSRIGLGVMPLEYTAPDTRKHFDRTTLELFIRDFIVKKVKKPSGIVNIFPYQALAYDIEKGFVAEKAVDIALPPSIAKV